MTKRQHNLQTRRNHGARMARDERDGYRQARHLPTWGSGATARTWPRDRLEERAALRARHPHLATLALGSPLRAPVEWRLRGRLPRLSYTEAERAAASR
jgi:hypothetical protein